MKTFFVRYQAFALFFCIAAVVAFIQFSAPALLASDDGYRHLATARAIIRDGWMAAHAMPWLPISFFFAHPSDQWFLYHWMLVPFVLISPLAGMKIFIILAVLAVAVAIRRVLATISAKPAWLWIALFLFGSLSFFYRIQIGRAFTITILFFLLILDALFRRHSARAGFFFAAALLIHAVAIIFLPFFALFALLLFWKERDGASAWRFVAAALAGGAAGIFFRPHPLEFLSYLPLLFQIPFRANIASAFAFGGEVYGLAPSALLTDSFLIIGMLIPALAWMIVTRKERGVTDHFLFFSSIATGAASLFSLRVFDFFVPLAVLTAARALSPILASEPWRAFVREVRQGRSRLLFAGLCVSAILFFGVRIANVAQYGRESLNLRDVVQALSAIPSIPSGGDRPLALNTQWDIFPILFFARPDLAYVTGMDSTFLFLVDPALFWRWHALSRDLLTVCPQEQCARYENIPTVLKENFHARYVVAPVKRNPMLIRYMTSRASDFSLLSQNDTLAVFAIK